VIAIILFIVLVGVAFAVMDHSGILKLAVGAIIRATGGRKYTLLLVITFFFMALGGFFGIFEEIIPLVPIVIALAYSLGWDSLTGMGMSVLATNVGFSMAVFNPFTIGVSHRLAGLPLFSGAGLRLIWFFIVYAILAAFLRWHARRVELSPAASPVYNEDQGERQRRGVFTLDEGRLHDLRRRADLPGDIFVLIRQSCSLTVRPHHWRACPSAHRCAVHYWRDWLRFAAGVGALPGGRLGRASSASPRPSLLLMAASVKHIVASGGILDTILHSASTIFVGTSPLTAALMIYGLTLVLELFISSGSAKALLVIPILMPLADLVGVNRQIAVSAYVFGDGFSNLAYPTNAALLITLSLTVVPYAKWLKWLLRLWFWVFLATLAFLVVAVAINYGPF
jgi:uncharacterized ion transporter superfamily protein YfcC